jgi:hypothetical protein
LHARLGKVDSTYVDTIADHQQRDHARSSERDPIVARIMEQPVPEAPVNVPIAIAYVSRPGLHPRVQTERAVKQSANGRQ